MRLGRAHRLDGIEASAPGEEPQRELLPEADFEGAADAGGLSPELETLARARPRSLGEK